LAYSRDIASDLHHDYDRQILAREDFPMPTEDVIPEVFPAYSSFDAIATELKPKTASARVQEHDNYLAGVVGWEFFVPADTKLSDEDLLAERLRATYQAIDPRA
jgi:hypothetical protein